MSNEELREKMIQGNLLHIIYIAFIISHTYHLFNIEIAKEEGSNYHNRRTEINLCKLVTK